MTPYLDCPTYRRAGVCNCSAGLAAECDMGYDSLAARELDRLREVMCRWAALLVATGNMSVREFFDDWYGPSDGSRVHPPSTLVRRLYELEAPHRQLCGAAPENVTIDNCHRPGGHTGDHAFT